MTGDVNRQYLDKLEAMRNDSAKEKQMQHVSSEGNEDEDTEEALIDMHNSK